MLGLTGSIGMGKSTTAAMFRDEGVPVWSADDAVHRIYSTDSTAIAEVSRLCPEAGGPDGIDRQKISDWIMQDASNLRKLEEVIHPRVAEDRVEFLAGSESDVVVLDIPLLFETGLSEEVDVVAVVSTTAEEQRRRVLERPGMTEKKFRLILSQQTPDQEKRLRADYVIDTSTLEGARSSVRTILNDLKDKKNNA